MISVVIPCAQEHFSFLIPLLDDFLNQSLYPNEVIISLSEFELIDSNDMTIFENKINNYIFKIILLKNTDKLSPGENRQLGSDKSEYDYIIYQDADDFPHRQRFEILNYIFEKYNANHITHLLTRSSKHFNNRHKLEDIIPFKWNKRSAIKGSPTTAGNIGVHKRVFEKVKWTNHKVGEDTRFTDAILSKFDNCYRLGITLHLYRPRFSTDHN